ncbi:MAG: type II toxin-antitoxin system VapC family toxin [Thermodesulfobacteriota bacterium]
MLYVDTSAIVKLYVREALSMEISEFLRENDQALPLTRFHELEFSNALHLKTFRAELSEAETMEILSRFKSHEESGIYFRPLLTWSYIFDLAVNLSSRHTKTLGARSLDVLHVASAISLKADHFLTVDERQAKLAHSAGLVVHSLN